MMRMWVTQITAKYSYVKTNVFNYFIITKMVAEYSSRGSIHLKGYVSWRAHLSEFDTIITIEQNWREKNNAVKINCVALIVSA